jgi:hypothetical protein
MKPEATEVYLTEKEFCEKHNVSPRTAQLRAPQPAFQLFESLHVGSPVQFLAYKLALLSEIRQPVSNGEYRQAC